MMKGYVFVICFNVFLRKRKIHVCMNGMGLTKVPPRTFNRRFSGTDHVSGFASQPSDFRSMQLCKQFWEFARQKS